MPDLKINEIVRFPFKDICFYFTAEGIFVFLDNFTRGFLIKDMFFRFFLETTFEKLAGLSFRKIVNLVRKKTSCKLKNNSLFDCRVWIDFSSNFCGFKNFYFVMNLQGKSYSQRIKIWCESFQNPWVLCSYLHNGNYETK